MSAHVPLPFAALALLASSALAGDSYVDVATGVDVPAGGSAEAPWKTISYALGQLAPPNGTIEAVHVAAGPTTPPAARCFPSR